MPLRHSVDNICEVAFGIEAVEEWLHELLIDMFAADCCVTISGGGENSITAFRDFGSETLRETILEERSSGTAPPKCQPKAPT
jgi:hypothetical protein